MVTKVDVFGLDYHEFEILIFAIYELDTSIDVISYEPMTIVLGEWMFLDLTPYMITLTIEGRDECAYKRADLERDLMEIIHNLWSFIRKRVA